MSSIMGTRIPDEAIKPDIRVGTEIRITIKENGYYLSFPISDDNNELHPAIKNIKNQEELFKELKELLES